MPVAGEDLSSLKIERREIRPGRRGRKGPVLWVVLAGAVLAGLAFSGVLSPAVEVSTATASLVYPTQTFTRLNASGYVVAQRKAAVAAKATGRLVWLGVAEGSRVRKGEIIARLENEDVLAAQSQAGANLAVAAASLGEAAANIGNAEAALAQARAELADSKLNLDRQKALLKRGMVARADYDTAEARYKKARAAVLGAQALIRSDEAARDSASAGVLAAEAVKRAADVNVEYTLIRAPFDAVVLTKNADIGDIVTPIGASVNAQAAVVTIADMGSLEVEADVSESNLGEVKEDGPCEIQLDAIPGRRFLGEVATIVPTADRSKASVMVKVRFLESSPGILPEMSAKVAFLSRTPAPGERVPRLAVSPAAVAARRGASAVFVVKGGRAHETPVKLGGRLGDWVVVTGGGLKAGDKVAVSSVDRLEDGSKVKAAAE